jgi:pilus assembly protein Flp/PilA
MRQYIRGFWKETQGQDLIEYALAAGLVAVAAVAAMGTLGTTISSAFSKVGSYVTSAMAG